MSTTTLAATPSEDSPPPGWRLARSQFPERVTPLIAAIQTDAFNTHAERGAAAIGLPFYFGLRFVGGWAYLGPVPRLVDVAERPATGLPEEFWTERRWTKQLSAWPKLRAKAVAANRAMQSLDPGLLNDEDLGRLLRRLVEHHHDMIICHHELTNPTLLSLGVFVEAVGDWCGATPLEAVLACSGVSAASAIDAPDCAAAAEAAGALLDREDPLDVLRALHDVPSARTFLDDTIWRIANGFDLLAPWVGERPDWIVERLRRSRRADAGTAARTTGAARMASLRQRIPAGRHAEFDALASEALAAYAIRDDRGLVSDAWSLGLLRRGVREAGRRLVGRGLLERWQQLAFVGPDDLPSTLSTRSTVHATAVTEAERAFFDIESAEPVEMPAEPGASGLGTTSHDPGALPPGVARYLAVGDLLLRLVVGEPARGGVGAHPGGRVGPLRGVAASPGTVTGPARVIRTSSDLHRLEPGDVLFVPSTTEAFTAAAHVIAAIVTDHGSVASHAAILARELGIPAVVGTRWGTQQIPDGSTVCVDGSDGTVTVLQ